MRTEEQIEHFVRCLRGLSTDEFPGQLKERAIARQTLWVMGIILIRPIIHRLAEANELNLIYPIAKLYLALGHLDHGWVPPVLQPSTKSGRPKESGASYKVRGAAAAAMTALMEQGQQPAERAARAVARLLDKKGIRQRNGKPIEWTTITAWRKKILKKTKTESGAEGSNSDVYIGCRILVSLRKAALHHKPLPEPITLAREVLEDGLAYSTPVRLWGIDEATREFY